VLCYLVQLVDSTIPTHDGIGTSDDRVEFLNGITTEIATRLNLSLDGRKLYSGDGYAVQELMKLAQYIHIAMAVADQESSSNDSVTLHAASESAGHAQTLAKDVAEMGASIQQLLKHEAKDGVERASAIQFLSQATVANENSSEKNSIESSLREVLNETNDAVNRLDKQCKMLLSTNKGMEEKIRKRNIDLERNNKRLESLNLHNVRPAFMDEYEQIEQELQMEYERYVVRFRNIDYLEAELRKMQKKYRADELRVLEGSDCSEDDEIDMVCPQTAKSRGKENSRPGDNNT
jgi:clusterin-associated protein 1